MGGMPCTKRLEGCQHSHHLSAGKIFARILLNRLSSHITPEVVPETQCGFRSNRCTSGKVHRAGSTSVYCLCRLNEGIWHRWEDWTMVATEEIWMPWKVHNHDRNSAYRNDGERQEWRGGLRYICYNKRCCCCLQQPGPSSSQSRFPLSR